MSRVLVIPDVHLKPWIFDMADRIDEGSYDDIVILGDLVDDWGKKNCGGTILQSGRDLRRISTGCSETISFIR